MQNPSLNTKRGFTLTEVLVVGLIATLLGVGIVHSLTWMFATSRTEEQTSHLQTEANIIIEDIARRVHVSTTIATPTSHLLQFYTGGSLTRTISISNDTLLENGQAFKVSGTPVLLDATQSFFAADSTGEFLNAQLHLRRQNAHFTLHTGTLRCRN